MTPFQALYGTPPPTIAMYLPGTTTIHSVDVALQNRDELLRSLKSNMSMAQNRMKQFADLNRTERTFGVNDWVFLKLHPYRQKSLLKRASHKLSPRFYGPFQISAYVGKAAYLLNLPQHSRIHPVFHVSLLKKRLSADVPRSTTLPPFNDQGGLIWTPLKVLDMAIVCKNKRIITNWLIQWVGLPEADATWEEAHSIASRFPDFCT